MKYHIEAYIQPSRLCTGSRSVRCIIQPEKRHTRESENNHSAIYWSTWKTCEYSRHRCCLTLNFGCNGNHLYSHRFKPLREACVPESTSAAKYVIRVRVQNDQNSAIYIASRDANSTRRAFQRFTGSTKTIAVNVSYSII